MQNYREEINLLQSRLQILSENHLSFTAEINGLKAELETVRAKFERKISEIQPQQQSILSEIELLKSKLATLHGQLQVEDKNPVQAAIVPPIIIAEQKTEIPVKIAEPVKVTPLSSAQTSSSKPTQNPSPVNASLERYIGENLIPLIGIVITVIGVGIGAKYAIDHQLINPITRILLAYLAGAILCFLAVRLKKKYHHFSAVLLGGSMTIFYFITYFAYSFYGLIPLSITFLMMVLITGFTVYSAIKYNLQLIAHIALVGAYAVPFMLNTGSGKIGIFFSYMTVINIGILLVSFFRDWKALHYVTFGLTWFIFYFWYSISYQEKHFSLAILFLSIFFLLFYVINLAYKLAKQQKFDEIDGMLILFNAMIFYGLGMTILIHQQSIEVIANLVNTGTVDSNVLNQSELLTHSLSIFTLLNAIVHGVVAFFLYRRKPEDRSFYLIPIGLSLLFVTLFFPIQFDGNWLTLLWILETGLLFWLGRTKGYQLFEKFSYLIMLLAFFSLCSLYFSESKTPFFNMNLASALIFAGVLFSIRHISRDQKYIAVFNKNAGMHYLTENAIFVLLIVVLFFAFQIEISRFWSARYSDSYQYSLSKDYFREQGDVVLLSMKSVCNLLYSLLFLGVFAGIYQNRKNTEEFKLFLYLIYVVCIILFLTFGLYQLNFMHLKHLHQLEGNIYYRGFWLIGIRYFSYAILALSFYQFMRFVKKQMPEKSVSIISEYILHTVIVWCCCAELVNWVHSINSAQAYKLAISIFAGSYSLFLIVLGIWKQKSYLRIGAISLFGIMLLKLFFYDISQLNTIFKTIIFISLGILLLIIAYLYNKYKGRMFGEQP